MSIVSGCLQGSTLHSSRSFDATNVRSSNTTLWCAGALTTYVANVANITQHHNAKVRPISVWVARESAQPGIKAVPTQLVKSKPYTAINMKHRHTSMNNQAPNRPIQTITILQYNFNKSQPITHSVLNSPISSKYAVLMLQEQYYSSFMNSSLTHHS